MKMKVFCIVLSVGLVASLVADFVLYKRLTETYSALDLFAQVSVKSGILELDENGVPVVNKVIRYKDLPPVAEGE